jgi:hypothetical protein
LRALKKESEVSDAVNPDIQYYLRESIALVDSHRTEIASKIAFMLSLGSGPGNLNERDADNVTVRLLDFLIEQARSLLGSGKPEGLAIIELEHRVAGVEGSHYLRFADALTIVLRHVLGYDLPAAFASAWHDTFWAIIRLMRLDRRLLDP